MTLGKPTGISLAQHVSNVMHELTNRLPNMMFIINKYREYFSDIDLVNELIKSVLLHDEGKKHPRWQKPCQEDFKLHKQNLPFRNLLTANFRHEIQSCLYHFDDLTFEQFVAIVAHHGKLKMGAKMQEKYMTVENVDRISDSKVYTKLLRKNHHVIQKFTYRELVLETYKLNAQRTLLQFCDRKGSYFENSGKSYEKELHIDKFQYDFPKDWKLRKIQKIAKENALKYDLLLILAKTGGGKTAAGMLWADQHIQAGNADRLIIVLPTIFTVFGMERSINESVGGEIAKSYSSANKFKRNNVDLVMTEEEKEAFNQHFYFDLLQRRTFQYPVTITTVDHVLNAIAQQSEEAHMANFNLANSCMIIDEADFYDDLVLGNIKELLTYVEPLKVKTLLMSATIPDSYRNFFTDISPDYKVSNILIDNTGMKRKRYEFMDVETYDVENPYFSDNIIKNIKKSTKTIWFANTVATSLKIKQWLEKHFDAEEIILFNSNFAAPDKDKKQKEILANFGENSTENKYKIAVLTQVGEMSLNISADYQVTDVAPIGNIIQRLGRCGRYDKKKEIRKVSLLIPTKNDSIYPPPYGDLSPDKKSWILSQPLMNTIKLLKKGTYSIAELNKINNQVYVDGVVLQKDAIRNVNVYRENIKNNWLFVPDRSTELEESENGNETVFKRRRFLPMIDVFIKKLEKDVYSKAEYNYIFTHNTVRIHSYLIDNYLNTRILESRKVMIQNDPYEDRELTIFQLKDTSMYTYINGLDVS